MSTNQNKPIEIEETLKEFIKTQLNGVYTMTMVVVESVDTDRHEVEVSFKFKQDVKIPGIPIASPYVGKQSGMVVPVSKADEGFILHNRRPIDEAMTKRGNIEQQSDRKFTMEDAVFMPEVWNGDLSVPSYEKGEFVISHESGTLLRMKPDGSFVVEHTGGNVIQMGPDGTITLGNKNNAAALLNENAVIEYEDTGDSSTGGAGASTKQAIIKDPGTSNVDGA